MKKIFVLSFGLLLAGCGSLVEFPWSGEGPSRYEVVAPSLSSTMGEKADWRLIVEDIAASGAIASDGILVRVGPQELTYYENARWSDRAPRLVGRYVTEALGNAGRFNVIGANTYGIPADYRLKIDLRQFVSEIRASNNPQIKVALETVLVRGTRSLVQSSSSDNNSVTRGRVLNDMVAGQRTFEVTVSAANDSVSAVVSAYNEALNQIIEQMVPWIVATAE